MFTGRHQTFEQGKEAKWLTDESRPEAHRTRILRLHRKKIARYLMIHHLLSIYRTWPPRKNGNCGGLDEKCPSQAPVFKHLVPSWWHCLRRFKRHGLVAENMALLWEQSLKLFSLHFLCFMPVFRCECSAFSPCHHPSLLLSRFQPRMDFYPNGTMSQNNSFLSHLGYGCHNNWKETNTLSVICFPLNFRYFC